MFYHKQNSQANILKGLQIDEPMIFVPWDIDENVFSDMFKDHSISLVVENNYLVKDVTILGESHCNIGVQFDNIVSEVSISRDDYGEYHPDYMKSSEALKIALMRSFMSFQTALIREFGQPNKREILDTFESFEWHIYSNIKIYHYIMDRFGLAEYLRIKKF